MFYRQHKTFWYQFCNLKHFLKAENSEDIFASLCEQNSVTFHVTQSETELLLELWNHTIVHLLTVTISKYYTCLHVSICSHTQELTPYKLLNMSLIPGGGYSTLSWVQMCGPKFRPPPYNKTREDANLLPIYLNHSFLEGPFIKPISAFYNVNWDA